MGRRLSDLFPGALMAQFDRTRGDTGVHNFYKQILKKSELPVAAGHNGNGPVQIEFKPQLDS